MNLLSWDVAGEKQYETGVRQGVFYPRAKDGKYPLGVVWNGLTTVTESPTGAEATALYADDIKYLNLMSIEELEATIEAYMYPDEFAACDGSLEIAKGVTIGQQPRQMFGFSYRTIVGNDIENEFYGYKLHIIYGCLASPSEKAHASVNDSPEAINFSWAIKTSPVQIQGFKPTASLTIDSTKVKAADLAKLEAILYGTAADATAQPPVLETPARLPLPDEIGELFGGIPQAQG